ncbi:c-type cytochrome [Emticicia sp. TH156]|uniref:c-type cytochrome n=1 Tax=Emticicia sp. TH156 TaxID=2067454 RepID=UPI000C7769FA|nr:c-type cytochrome [Emticicia sp. TH156]PLK43595.1 cytochrome C [Emticicia sp. TH156]
MKKTLRFVGYFVLFAAIVVGALLAYVKLALPDIEAPQDLKVEATPQRIERGKYLAYNVTVCMDCHSSRDFSLFSGPLTPGTDGKGGDVFDHRFGFPGTFYARNITPFNLKDWTDGEIYRAITSGVKKDGSPIFPVMPYVYYGQMDKEDVYSIIAFLRTLKPIESTTPEPKADFPMNFILHTIPAVPEHKKIPDTTHVVEYGKYLAFSAGCFECHTKPDDKGKKLEGMDFAGGWSFNLGDGSVVTSSNLTPDKQTGLGNYTKEAFIARFKAYADSGYKAPKIGKGAFNTLMPWTMYAGMKTQDLAAIYEYLKTVKPVSNKVEKFVYKP